MRIDKLKVDMGGAEMQPEKIPVKLNGENVIARIERNYLKMRVCDQYVQFFRNNTDKEN